MGEGAAFGTIHRMTKPLGIAAAAFGASAVALGAFGAHALRSRLEPAALEIWHTAVEYQFWHALVLTALALASTRLRFAHVAASAFTLGIVLFCGSLYALALGAPHAVGIVTPFGGVALIAGWLALRAGWCSATTK